MRLWTLHPRYLDTPGLLAVWREGLLALHVLQGRTRGYRHHPQLIRFRQSPAPLPAIRAYLAGILAESIRRGYRFDGRKIRTTRPFSGKLAETRGQLLSEKFHLLGKLRTRCPARARELAALSRPAPHPLFRVVPGPVRDWEKSIRARRTNSIAAGAAASYDRGERKAR